MARKSKSVARRRVVSELPKGYKAITGGGSWQYELKPVLEGALVKFGKTPSKYKKGETQRFAILATKDGDVTVWESAALRALFDLKPKAKVCLMFRGMKKIKGRKLPMKDFVVGVA